VTLAAFGSALAIAAGATEDGSASLLMGQVGLWTGFTATAVVAGRCYGSGNLRADFGPTIKSADIAKSVVIGVAVQTLAIPGIYRPLIAAGVELDVSGPAEALFRDVSGLEKIAIATGVIGVAPVAEELLFRGVLLGGLAHSIGDRAAVWVSAIVFAASHFQMVQFPGLLAVGLTLAWLARRTGGLAAPIWAHAAFNATTVAFLW
jgi:membrane protease YdiL (CAAX protease family)